MKRIGQVLLEATQPKLQQIIATHKSQSILDIAKRLQNAEANDNGIREAIEDLPPV